MRRLLAIVLVLTLASTAMADLLPPTPKGFKRVPASHQIVTEKEFPEYSLFVVKVAFSAPGQKTERTAVPAKLDTKTPLVLHTQSGASFTTSYELVVVPKDAAKEFANEKYFLKAIADGKVNGQLTAKTKIGGGSSTLIPEKDARKEAVTKHKLEKIDKDGIGLTTEKSNDPVPPPGCEDAEDADSVTAAPKNGSFLAGLGFTGALLLTGLWLAGRNRRRAIAS
ncbi:MAG: hypothetical protein U0792_19520 [Gemmataceae bacterium]